MPPFADPGDEGRFDLDAPLARWSHLAAFATAFDCERGRLDLAGAAGTEEAPAQARARVLRGRCVHRQRLDPLAILIPDGRWGRGHAWAEDRSPTPFDPLIREAADRHGLEYALVKAVIKAESNFDPRAISPKGARGLMQLMPTTALQHRVHNVFSPRDNVEGGCRHLRMLLDRYAGNVTLALAAYNAGTEPVDARRAPPAFAETRTYLRRVLRLRAAYQREVTASVDTPTAGDAGS